MKLWYSDDHLQIISGFNISSFGVSFKQSLADGIIFSVDDPNAHMIQFKARYIKWLAGPEKGYYMQGLPGYAQGKWQIDWDVDVVEGQKPDPYYDTGGAHIRSEVRTIFADQPEVSFHEGLAFPSATKHPTKDKFRGVSVLILRSRAEYEISWSRAGTGAGSYYNVSEVKQLDMFPLMWKLILTQRGFKPPAIP